MSYYKHYPLDRDDIDQVGGQFTLHQLLTIAKHIPGVSFQPAYATNSVAPIWSSDSKNPAYFASVFESMNVPELPYFITYPLEHHNLMFTVLSVWLSMDCVTIKLPQ